MRNWVCFLAFVCLFYCERVWAENDGIEFERVYIASTWKKAYGPQVIIKSDSVFKLMTGGNVPDSVVDFRSYDLLGMIITGDCDARFEYDVLKKDENRSYYVKIYNNYCGCPIEKQWYFWLKVSKIQDGYRYIFDEELIEKFYTEEEQKVNMLLPRFQKKGFKFDSTSMDPSEITLFEFKKKLIGSWILNKLDDRKIVAQGTGAQVTTWHFTGDEIKVQMGNYIQQGVYKINNLQEPWRLIWQMSNQIGYSKSIIQLDLEGNYLLIKVNSKGSSDYAREFGKEENYRMFEFVKRPS